MLIENNLNTPNIEADDDYVIDLDAIAAAYEVSGTRSTVNDPDLIEFAHHYMRVQAAYAALEAAAAKHGHTFESLGLVRLY